MLRVTIDISPEEVRELERDMVRRVMIKEAGMGDALLEDTVLARVIDAALSVMGEE